MPGPHLRDDVPPPEVLTPEPPLAEWELDQAMTALAQGLPWHHHLDADGDPVPWTPADLAGAEWAMSMLRFLSAELESLNAQADGWRDGVEQWRERATRRARLLSQLFQGMLERWGMDRRDRQPELRTLPLPSGEVRATVPQAATVVVADEQKAVGWLKAHEAVGDKLSAAAIKRTPDSIRLPELRRAVKPILIDGEWMLVHVDSGVKLAPEAAGLAVEPPAEPTYRVKPER